MTAYQIILLPKADYLAWVEAAREYTLRFQPNLTSDPDTAGRFMAPQQIVTLAGGPGGYPGQGEIRAWFRANYPGLRLDYIPAATPGDLKAALAARLAAGQRYLAPAGDLQLRWPTDFAILH